MAHPLPTALELHQQIVDQQRTASNILEETIARIEANDGPIGAFLSKTYDHARAIAQEVDRKVAAGETLPLLAGVPIAIKDNLNMVGTRTTCASKILEGYESPYNATVVDKLNQHLMPIVGKTNLDEFAMGSSNENSAFQPTRNPWDLKRVPGGSSGGSAAAVASGMVPLALGSDTGGSVRQPAAFCGIVGLKPTYGFVSRYGLVAFGSSLDQVSPFARTVEDTAALLSVISSHDPMDGTSLKVEYQNTLDAEGVKGSLAGKTIGIIEELEGKGIDPDIQTAMDQTIAALKAAGAATQKISIPTIRHAIEAYYILAPAEASSNLARFDGVRYGLRIEPEGCDIHTMYRKTRSAGFGPEVKRRIMLGTFVLSAGYYDAYYGKAQQVRLLLKQSFEEAFEQVDALMGPTTPTTAFPIGEKADDPVSMYMADVATIPANMAGVPAISLPCGTDAQGLPIGVQLFGPAQQDDTLLAIAREVEAQTGWRNRIAPQDSAVAS